MSHEFVTVSVGRLAFLGIDKQITQLTYEEREDILRHKDYYVPISIYVSSLEFKSEFNMEIHNQTMYKTTMTSIDTDTPKDVYLNVCDIDDSDYLIEMIICN